MSGFRSLFIYSLILVYPVFSVVFYVFSDCSPYEIDLTRVFQPPSFEFPLGTNELGQDLSCMIGGGVLTSLKVAFFSSFFSFVIGGVLGLIAGYSGGVADELISRAIEFFQGFPSLVFVIFIVALFGGGDINVILALCVFGWTSFARISRAETMRLKNEEFILSARVIGAGIGRIARLYILPFVLPALLTQLMFSFSAFILAEGSLGFLGLRPEESVSLGGIISMEIDFILTHPELVMYPGLALTCLAVFFNLMGQELISAQKNQTWKKS